VIETSLPTSSLGSEGPRISRVGTGTWAIGGAGGLMNWGPQDDEASLDTLRHAAELGLDWIDTAPAYGLGHAEEVIGRFLRERSAGERPYIFTKCGIVWDESDLTAPARRMLTPESIRRECEASLRRLGVERIDLYQFHWPDETGTPVEDSWGEVARLSDEGKVRWGGVSNFTVELLERCEKIRHVDSLQPPLSLIRRDAAESEIPWCVEHGTGVICYSPMQSGLLTDSFSAERLASLPENDWRRRSPRFQSPNLERSLALRDALRPIAARHDSTVSAVAIAWVLAWPGVTAAIAGARAPEQIDGWISAAKLRLTPDDLEEIAGAIEQTGAGSGPVRPASEGARTGR
jgi:Predicted oxidoreductases (related to aryl-alcohol dehydrogenases)